MNEETLQKQYCYNHAQRETLLRCNRCERPICTECAILTPTGYRCKECVRGQQKTFETTQTADLIIGPVIALILSFVGSYIASFLGFFTIFIAPVAGVIIAEAVRGAVRRRRSRLLYQLTTGAAILGSLPLLAINLLNVLLLLGANGAVGAVYGFLPAIWQGVYTFFIASTVYYRLSGIEIGRRR